MAKKDSVKYLSLRDQYNLSLKNLRSSAEFQSSSIKDQHAILNDLKERYEQAKKAEEEQKKQISLAQAAQNAEALQALEEQKKQQRQKAGMEQLKAEEEFRSQNPGVRELQAMSKANSFYGYGLGGSTPWTTKSVTDPQTGAIKRVQVLDPRKYITPDRPYAGPQDKRKPAPMVLGSGMANRQEFRGMVEAKAPTSIGSMGNIVYGEAVKGVNVIEAPEKFVRGKGTSERDSARQFYSEVTGRPMGTLMGRGAYGGFGGRGPQSNQRNWDNYVAPSGPRNPSYGSNPQKIASAMAASQPAQKTAPTNKPVPSQTPIPQQPPSFISGSGGYGYTSTPLGFTGNELSFTPAGRVMGARPSPTPLTTGSPFPMFEPNRILEDYYGGAFGGSRFPYAGY